MDEHSLKGVEETAALESSGEDALLQTKGKTFSM